MTEVGYLTDASGHKSIGRLIPAIITGLLCLVAIGSTVYFMLTKNWIALLIEVLILSVCVLGCSYLMNKRKDSEIWEAVEEMRHDREKKSLP